MSDEACTNCKHGEYYSDKQDIWCCLYEKWVGIVGSCSRWERIGAGGEMEENE